MLDVGDITEYGIILEAVNESKRSEYLGIGYYKNAQFAYHNSRGIQPF
jgi:hypothetical protein